MLAGQWFARACELPSLVPPAMAFSCFATIFQENVVQFGGGQLLGAVNGMKPGAGGGGSSSAPTSPATPRSGNCSPVRPRPAAAVVDDCCLQSREVWTGTTYGLAAAMLHEALHRAGAEEKEEKPLFPSASASSSSTPLPAAHKEALAQMGVLTAQGIHDAGWQRWGYQFATPEGWERGGHYRSLGYMRPLAIWAMQYALEQGGEGSGGDGDEEEEGEEEEGEVKVHEDVTL
jgi:non-lysosomal glucosylceramidase